MRLRIAVILATLLLCLAPTAGWCDLAPFSQDFEQLDQTDPGALAGDGWLVFANVFNPDWIFFYNYGPFPAPNGGPGFCGIDIGQGGPDQGEQQLVVYNDYNNGDHANGLLIEANVFQEQTIGAADVGTTWRFEFDAKRGNIEGGSTALAFFKTLDPSNEFALTNFITIDMTSVPITWDSYFLTIFIDPALEGQILQFGFLNVATNYEGAGIFYDNVGFRLRPLSVSLDLKPGSCPNPINSKSRGVYPAAVLGTADFDVMEIDITTLRIEGEAPIRSNYEDVSTPFEGDAGDLCGCSEAGPDGFLDLTLKFVSRELIDAAVDGRLQLTGALFDGTPIEGQDCIVMRGGGNAGGQSTVRDPERDGSAGTSSLGRPSQDTNFGFEGW